MFGLSKLYTLLIIAGLAVSGLGGGWLYLRHLQKEASVARSEAVAAQAAEHMRSVETRVIERYHTETRVIHEKAEAEVAAIQELPHATDQIDPDRRAALCAALSRLRDNQPACSDPSPGEPSPDL